MKRRAIVSLAAACVAAATPVVTAGQSGRDAAAHRAAAKAAAGDLFPGLFQRICAEPQQVSSAQRGQPAPAPAPAARREPPPRDQWHADPVKVFDNFYFVGTREHGAWAVTTTEGLIVIDALYDYAVIDEVEAGLKKLGLDPTTMKYLIISHGHGDHHGGTKYLQDKYRPRVVMGPADWDLVERDTRNPRPARDIAATDGQKITLGDTTVTIYITPGHTASTISLLVPVKDGGRTHMAASWGGTAFNPGTTPAAIKAYVESARRFRDLAAKAGADVIFTNHTAFDNTTAKLAAVAARRPGAPHPYVIGAEAVKRYLTVAEECGLAAIAAGR